MHFPIPQLTHPVTTNVTAIVQAAARADVTWNRPIFKAPPLERYFQGLDARRLAQELRSVGLVQR